jgi:general L-amino acid transport system permease protein
MSDISYVQKEPVARRAPPASLVGPMGWARENLFSSPANTVLTLVTLGVILWVLPGIFRFLITDAVFSGANREACLIKDGVPMGACWAFVKDRFSFFIYGFYPLGERWRVDIFFVLLALGVVWMLWLKAPRRDLGMVYFLVVMPLASFFLLKGAPLLGLKPVDTALWGGLMVTLVVAGVAIVVSLPLGVLLALGRRSQMPIVKFFSVLYIEFVRGVPLVGMLFMANVMLPLFLPGDVTVDKLLRAVVGISLFASAYMAEVVRAGLQALPKGQYEGAMSLGLGYWQMMRLIVLPQALKITIPNIVNNYVALFKDTSLLLIVGIFDFLKAIQTASIDPQWAVASASVTGYVFAAIVYFAFCNGMSRYAKAMETRLNLAQKR